MARSVNDDAVALPSKRALLSSKTLPSTTKNFNSPLLRYLLLVLQLCT